VKQSFAELLVHLDATTHTAARMAVAGAIAQANGAVISAIYANTPALLTVPFAPEAAGSAATMLGELDDERRAVTQAAFKKSCATAGVHADWAELTDYPIAASFARRSLYSDLLILGQHNAGDPGSRGVPADFPESVMVASGKPVLILPYAFEPAAASVADNIVIAWKPTREAAHAVSAAVPLLQRARSVHVLSWLGHVQNGAAEQAELDRYFKLRGIEAAWHPQGDEPEGLGEVLLSRAFDLEADLLVMGCYGHSRAREWVLGGTSRTILQSMTLPVLMAH
jgi:nucleotide-binding universal stress UspA family protein